MAPEAVIQSNKQEHGFQVILFLCMCESLCVCHIYVDAHEGHERVLHPLVLEFEVIKSHLTWALGLLSRRATSPAQFQHFKAFPSSCLAL